MQTSRLFFLAANVRAFFQLIAFGSVAICVFDSTITNCTAQNQELTTQAVSPDALEFFEVKIRPVLIAHCYECHNSRDGAEGALALDYKGGIIQGGESGPAINWRQPLSSYLLKLVRHEVAGLEMPAGRPKLPDSVITDLERWFEMGLPDPRINRPSGEELESELGWPSVMQRRLQAWCYQPIVRPVVPVISTSNLSPIDAFIRQQLNEQAIEPAPRADASQLVRRLFLILIGLPPSAEQAKIWTSRLSVLDPSARHKSYVKLVDELLASPHFGERWARHWMDWLRYAESHGSEGDPLIENAWHYRDYLIRALNDDIPFDQLVREHIAGDILEEPRLNLNRGIVESLIGAAHWRMVFHGFAPTDALDERVRFIDDQINVLTKAFLGLTVSCARCHDHKFDAIGQDDYYALFGILASNRASRHMIDYWPELPSRLESLRRLQEPIRQILASNWLGDVDGLRTRIRETQEVGGATSAELAGLLTRMRHIELSGDSMEVAWRNEVDRWHRAAKAEFDQESQLQADTTSYHWNLSTAEHFKQWYPEGPGLAEQSADAGLLAISLDGDQAVAGIYPSGVYSHRLSDKLPARLTSPDIQLTDEYEVWIEAIGSGDASIRYVVQDYPRDGTVYPLVRLTDGQWRWHRFDVSYWKSDQIHIELSHARDAPLMVMPQDRSWFGVRRVRLVRKGASRPRDIGESIGAVLHFSADDTPHHLEAVVSLIQKAILQSVENWKNNRCDDRQARLLDEAVRLGWLQNRLSQLPQAAGLINKYRELESSISVATRVPGLSEARIVDQPMFVRGDHHQPAEPVARRFPAFLPGDIYPKERSGRLELANDLLRPDNPLTRRVIVNRLWQHTFGRGIVATSDNFGLLGSEPTHPELLDWMAFNFSSQHSWSIKNFIRELVLTETWQQDSLPSPEARRSDPDNRHWSHALAGRLEAETIRDQTLAVAQALDLRLFGPPTNSGHPRRSIYLPVLRNSLNPFLRTFDFPEPFSSVGKRDATNVPAQSLALLNDPLVVTSALAMAQELLKHDVWESDSARINQLFWMCFGREPNAMEHDQLQEFLLEGRRARAAADEKISELLTQQAINERQLQALIRQVVQRWDLGNINDSQISSLAVAEPILSWDFDQLEGSITDDQRLDLRGNARIEQGRLIVRDGGYAVSVPLDREVTEKTLEAWVTLDDLNQRGGGLMTLQTADGQMFDSIVFGEQTPGLWQAGSEFFHRTQAVDASLETAVGETVVHFAITYKSNGEIALFRNGRKYGQPYTTTGPLRFPPGSVITLGLRHLPASGDRGLNGQILRARLYDRALSSDEIVTSFQLGAKGISLGSLRAGMTDEERQLWQSGAEARDQLLTELEGLRSTRTDPEVEVWQQLIHGLFMTQEFIYLR